MGSCMNYIRKISVRKPCFIIAEIGVNHNGSLEIAKSLIDEVKNIGADAVKFQTFKVEEIVSLNTKKADYQERAKEKTQFEMLKRLQLSYDEIEDLKKYCDKKEIEFISTPYDIESVDFLNQIGINKFKIASADLINKPLIRRIANTKKQVILSTGMATLEEIEKTVEFIQKCGNSDIVILHCITSYPAPYDKINMNILKKLKNKFDFPIGYSDHTLDYEIAVMAVSFGAKVIEKHITLDRSMEGPDHFASLEPDEFNRMVKSIRNVEKAFGSEIKLPIEIEKNNMYFMRRSIHAREDIKKGETINENNIKITRPFDGINPWFYDEVLGKKTKKNIKKDKSITWDVLK
jgi:N,N'-diacetyllegionaminate synthase